MLKLRSIDQVINTLYLQKHTARCAFVVLYLNEVNLFVRPRITRLSQIFSIVLKVLAKADGYYCLFYENGLKPVPIELLPIIYTSL